MINANKYGHKETLGVIQLQLQIHSFLHKALELITRPSPLVQPRSNSKFILLSSVLKVLTCTSPLLQSNSNYEFSPLTHTQIYISNVSKETIAHPTCVVHYQQVN
eukprot:TRINITY_DN9831_c0_g1_i1.p1 TRINITY_DN9831_c0_g1~~TRINITY_DN9831_c0_g1_i1.p1  ORF type:complete len:105 (+),score=9.58 TRINITY_DN9831_c0_g1_i1:1072-1386(+)